MSATQTVGVFCLLRQGWCDLERNAAWENFELTIAIGVWIVCDLKDGVFELATSFSSLENMREKREEGALSFLWMFSLKRLTPM